MSLLWVSLLTSLRVCLWPLPWAFLWSTSLPLWEGQGEGERCPLTCIPSNENKIVSWIQSWYFHAQEIPLPRGTCVCVLGVKGGRGDRRLDFLLSFLLLLYLLTTQCWSSSAPRPRSEGCWPRPSSPCFPGGSTRAQTPHRYRIFRPNSPLPEGRKFPFLPCSDQTLGLILCPHTLNF